MNPSIILFISVILVFANVSGQGILSWHLARHTHRDWLAYLVIFLTLGTLYCLSVLATPLDGTLKIVFLERLPYEVGMLLGLGLLWIQWMIQVLAYWHRRRHSPLMLLIWNTLVLGQIFNLLGIGLIFAVTPTMIIVQSGWSNDPSSYSSEWVFELGWLTYFSLCFITPLLLLSLKIHPKFWQARHWLAGLTSAGLLSWWVYWINCTDLVRLLPSGS